MNFDDDYDMIFKVVLVGDSGVGKTNILSRYIRDEFSIETKSTVGVEFGSKKVKIKGTTIKTQIWDTAGQERYKSITNAYYKGAKGALVVFDISRKETFTTVDRWIGELKSSADSEVSIILIGNKSDLEEQRQVSYEEVKAKADQYNLAYIETSALQAVNIDKAFNMMIEDIFKKFNKVIADGDEDPANGRNNFHNIIDLNSAPKTGEGKTKKECCK
jgi:Ras-related protein Rab-11A